MFSSHILNPRRWLQLWEDPGVNRVLQQLTQVRDLRYLFSPTMAKLLIVSNSQEILLILHLYGSMKWDSQEKNLALL